MLFQELNAIWNTSTYHILTDYILICKNIGLVLKTLKLCCPWLTHFILTLMLALYMYIYIYFHWFKINWNYGTIS